MPRPPGPQTPSTLMQRWQNLLQSLARAALPVDKRRGRLPQPLFRKAMTGPLPGAAITITPAQLTPIRVYRSGHLTGLRFKPFAGAALDHPNVRLPSSKRSTNKRGE